MATTEGALVASTNRGCQAIALSGGAFSVITRNGMTRAPLIRVSSVAEAAAMKAWVENPSNQQSMQTAFNSTTRFGRLRDITVHLAGRNVYLRFAAFTGDAMGMNMVSKGTVAALLVLRNAFPTSQVVSLSGNVCADKKPSAINWVAGRGRSVGVEVRLSEKIVKHTLKTNFDDLIAVNINKNLIGSAIAGSLGGFNAHASNIVSAIFLATGNDIAQNVESSTCMTLIERDGDHLHMSVTMPSVEVGTVGGGTSLPGQHAALAMMGCAGASKAHPGANADQLARVVAGTVLAGELSLISALASGDLVDSHLKLNRKKDTTVSMATPTPTKAAAKPILTSGAPATPAMPAILSFGHPSSGGPERDPMTPFEWTPAAAMTRIARDSVLRHHASSATTASSRAAANTVFASITTHPAPTVYTHASYSTLQGQSLYDDEFPRLPVP